MSRLEQLAIPVLRPLITDISLRLDSMAQAIVSIWGLKTAMVFEGVTPRDAWFYAQPERTNVMSAGFPKNSLVWFGRNANSGSLYALSRRMWNQPGERSPFTAGYVTTIGLGRLVLQILTLRAERTYDMTRLDVRQRPGPWSRALIRIWPPQRPSVSWPPRSSFSDSGTRLDQLAERFGP